MWFQLSPVLVVIAAVFVCCCTAQPARRKFSVQNVHHSLNEPEGRVIANLTSSLSPQNLPGSIVIPLGFDQFSNYFHKKLAVSKSRPKPKPPGYPIYPPFYPGYYPPFYPWPPIYPPPSTTTEQPTTTEEPTTSAPSNTTTTAAPTTTTTTAATTTSTTTRLPTPSTTKEPDASIPPLTFPPWWPWPTRRPDILPIPGTNFELIVREKPSQRSLRFPPFFNINQQNPTE